MKNYMGFSRDHSGSMRALAEAAMKDYNDTTLAVRDAAIEHYQDTIVSVVRCGMGFGQVDVETINSSVTFLKPLTTYPTEGQTPLFDSIGKLIEIHQRVPDAEDPNVAFVIQATTDGAENASRNYNARTLSEKIKQLQATDRWTFLFRVPPGHKGSLISLGVPEWNILEWDPTKRGIEVSGQATRQAYKTFFTARAAGATSTNRFYADLSKVTPGDVQATMKDISSEVLMWPISVKDNGKEIRPFVESKLNESYLKGAAFYQLMKTETIQDHKKLMIRDKTSNAIYEGVAARQMLGLPSFGHVRVSPGSLGNFDLFIQSTSVNRKLNKGTNVVYWKNAVR